MKKSQAPQIDTSEKSRRGRPKATRIYFQSLKKIQALKTRLDFPDTIFTFEGISDWVYGRSKVRVSVGAIYRFASGIEPKRAEVRKALGLPCYAPTEICPVHGIVHKGKCPIKKTFDENAAAYDQWKSDNAQKLADIVSWAESRTP